MEPQKVLSNSFLIPKWLAKPKSVQGCGAGGLVGGVAMWWAWGHCRVAVGKDGVKAFWEG